MDSGELGPFACPAGFVAHCSPTSAQSACELRGERGRLPLNCGLRSNRFNSAHDLAEILASFRTMREAMEHRMSMRVLLCVPVISAGMVAAALTLDANAALAAVECITEPNREPPEGGHWYYHVDRATDRKCWYLQALIPGTSDAPGAVPQHVSARPAAAPAARRSKPPMSESEEAALYLEFLRWKQKSAQ
jgi:hypothetical protein